MDVIISLGVVIGFEDFFESMFVGYCFIVLRLIWGVLNLFEFFFDFV